MIARLFSYRKKNPLASRLLLYILLFSSLITLFITFIQLFVDYKRDINLIEERLIILQNSFLGGLSQSAWSVNQNQIDIVLEGIRQMPDMVSSPGENALLITRTLAPDRRRPRAFRVPTSPPPTTRQSRSFTSRKMG